MSVTGLGRIATAEKMSIGQLREALENKTLPAYIAVPLIEEKMNMGDRMQAMAAMQQARQPRPPLGDQVMQRVAAQGIDTLPSNLAPAPGMAGGGIIAFAGGGDADEDEDDDDEISYGDTKMDKENEALLMRLMAARRSAPSMGAGMLGTGLIPPELRNRDMGIEAAVPVSRDMGIEQPPASAVTLSSSKEERSIGLRAPSGHKYENKIVSKAEQMGVDPQFALYIAGKETGGLRNPETAKSRAGAMGIMQLMPGTAKDMGVENPFDPEQNIEGGLRYAKLMMDKYKDPRIAAIAYNWGPGNTDKWLRAGADPDKLPRETRNYIASLREGGAIRFQNMGLVDPMFSLGNADTSNIMQRSELVDAMSLQELQEYNRTGIVPERLRSRVGERTVGGIPMGTGPSTSGERPKFGPPPRTAAQKAEDLVSQAQFEAQDIQEGGRGQEMPAIAVDPTLAATAKALEGGTEKATGSGLADKLEALLSGREKSIASQRQQDKYMALLAAGLGMMGGRSRYAAENIGQGALQGVAAMQAANRQRAAEENALLSGRVGQYRIGQGEALRKQLGEEAQQTRLTQQLSTARQNMIKNVAAAKKMDLNSISDPKLLSTIEAQADAMLARDPAYQAIYKRIYGTDFSPTQMAAGPGDYSKYGITPKARS